MLSTTKASRYISVWSIFAFGISEDCWLSDNTQGLNLPIGGVGNPSPLGSDSQRSTLSGCGMPQTWITIINIVTRCHELQSRLPFSFGSLGLRVSLGTAWSLYHRCVKSGLRWSRPNCLVSFHGEVLSRCIWAKRRERCVDKMMKVCAGMYRMNTCHGPLPLDTMRSDRLTVW